MLEFEGAVEGMGVGLDVEWGANVSLTETLESLSDVVAGLSAVAEGVGDASWDARLGKSDGGGYFWKKCNSRGGSDFATWMGF